MKRLAVRFLEALRDPLNKDKGFAYNRISNELKTSNGFCAGGILCDLMVQEYPEKYEWCESHDNKWSFVPVDTDLEHVQYDDPIPGWILSEIGLPLGSENGLFINDKSRQDLVDHGMNNMEDSSETTPITVLNDFDIPWSIIADVVEGALDREKEMIKNRR